MTFIIDFMIICDVSDSSVILVILLILVGDFFVTSRKVYGKINDLLHVHRNLSTFKRDV